MANKSSGGCLLAPFRLIKLYHKGIFLLFRAALVVMAFFLVGGTLFLWRVPWLAKSNDVDAFELLVRCLDTHQNQPLYLFEGYYNALEPIGIPFQAYVRVDKIETSPPGPNLGANRYKHLVFDEQIPLSDSKPRSTIVFSTTPHTMIPLEQLEIAQQNLAQLFPDAQDMEKVRAWGEGLFRHWWWNYSKKIRRRPAEPIIIEPYQGTFEEHLWFAWQRLTNGNPAHAPRLFEVTKLAHHAYPRPADFQAALHWANIWLVRQKEYHQQYRVFLEANETEKLAETPEVILPPPTETIRCWLVDQAVGLDPATRQKVRERWLAFFGPEKSTAVIAWGRKLEQERRQAGEPLPPADENIALLCVVERLTGTDGYGQRCRRLVPDVLAPPDWCPKDWKSVRNLFVTYIQVALTTTYPNDDLLFLAAGGDPFGLLSHDDNPQQETWFTKVLFFFFLIALLTLGLRDLIFIVLARWILRLEENPHFLAYQERQYRFDWRGSIISYVITPLSLWGIAWFTLKPPLEFLIPTPWHMLAGAYMALILGGTVVLTLNRLVALVLLRLGWDIHKTWLDEIIGTVLAVLVLAYFGNEPAALAASVVFALVPEILSRRAASDAELEMA